MNMNSRARLGEMPGGARMIEMNVAEKNVAHVVRGKARDPHLEGNGFEGGIGSGIKERDRVFGLECDRGDDSRVTQVAGIKNVDHSFRCLPELIKERRFANCRGHQRRPELFGRRELFGLAVSPCSAGERFFGVNRNRR